MSQPQEREKGELLEDGHKSREKIRFHGRICCSIGHARIHDDIYWLGVSCANVEVDIMNEIWRAK